jgi:ketosteroid isomerase-like protein
MDEDEPLTEALERVNSALHAMRNGDPAPYADCWARSEDATLFGAWGPIEHGWQPVTDTFRWVGGRFTGGTVEVEHSVVASSGDLAYTVGFERGLASVDGGEAREMVIRVTHVYRRIDGRWQLVHRHADFPPPDQR